MISFCVAGEPLGVNALYRSVIVRGRQRVLKSTPGRDYETALIAAARRARGTAPTIEKGNVAVRIAIYFGSERPDIDGPIKPILDALQAPGKPTRRSKRLRQGAGIYTNDRQVSRLFVERDVDPGAPRVEVYVQELPWLLADRADTLRMLFDAPPPTPTTRGQVRLLPTKVRSWA